ncbi:MAG: DUF2147 domain-containing protein [Nitrococcus sp.]|nr:DUF2147 domain-containing protein [Nitrococcus sp.]
MRVSILSVFFAALGISVAAFSADTGDAQGVYSGHVVWLKEPLFPADDRKGMAGKPKVDRLNPDSALRSRPIIGLAVLTGLHYAGSNPS